MTTATVDRSEIHGSLSHSERLISRIELALPTLTQLANQLINHPRLKEIYPELLVRLYWMIRCSVPTMEAAVDACRQRCGDDVAAALIPYLVDHIQEEKGHDALLLKDLEALGVSRENVWRRLAPPCVAAMEGAAHYWTVYHHPIAFLAVLIASECYPTSSETIAWIREKTGYPRTAFRTLELHSTVDQAHGKEALDALNRLPLNDWHHEVLGVAALHFLDGMSQMYRELLEEFED